MPLSLADHVDESIGIDPFDRFGDAGVKLARARGLRNVRFARADGMALPFAAGMFNLVLSHAVIEHVADALVYLQECRRVMAADGRLYLSTAPYLSFAGAHLPRLLVPIPLHWIFGRTIAFGTFRWLARHAPWTLKEPAHENSFIRDARRGIVKHDDLLEKVRVQRLRALIDQAGLRVVHEHLSVSGTVRRLPRALGRRLRDSPATQDYLLSNIEYTCWRGPLNADRSEGQRRHDGLHARASVFDGHAGSRIARATLHVAKRDAPRERGRPGGARHTTNDVSGGND